MSGKSSRDSAKVLKDLLPVPPLKETIKVASKTKSEIKFFANDELIAKIEKLKSLLKADSIEEVIEKLADEKLSQPKNSKTRVVAKESPQKHSRYIPVATKTTILERANHQCEFMGKKQRCQATARLEFAHVVPFALGGKNTSENLKLYCKSHNQFDQINDFGQAQFEIFAS
jgi:hypothetical protein